MKNSIKSVKRIIKAMKQTYRSNPYVDDVTKLILPICVCYVPGPAVKKLFSSSTQLSMKFFLLINVKMPTIVGILTFVSRENNILGLSESEKS